MLHDIPPGTHCFVDANIFYYHLVETPPLSEECSNFFERVEKQEVAASTSSVAIAEAIHKVMLADAVASNGHRLGSLRCHSSNREADCSSPYRSIVNPRTSAPRA